MYSHVDRQETGTWTAETHKNKRKVKEEGLTFLFHLIVTFTMVDQLPFLFAPGIILCMVCVYNVELRGQTSCL